MKKCFFALGFLAVLAAPAKIFGQTQATITGTVTDESKAVLPGSTITAIQVNTGRQYVAVTDSEGQFRIPNIAPGTYDLQAELAGFATVKVSRVELLVGQNATIQIALKLATVEETVTVTGEAPLVDTRSAVVAGNVDRRQMEELPLAGRNWMELAMLVKGITSNNVDKLPGVERPQDDFQLNVDGQQVTMTCCTSLIFGQPKFSREAIAEFQISTNQYDVTQGRSTAIQIQAITRSGTNTVSGSAYGYFRDDKLNGADAVAKQVLPFQDQQVGGTLGGPLKRDKLLYFVSYEYERQPQTLFFVVPLAPNLLGVTIPNTITNNSLMARVDQTVSSKDHLTYRVMHFQIHNPFEPRGGTNPTQNIDQTQKSSQILASWSRVLSNTAVQEFKVGYGYYTWAFHRQPQNEGQPIYQFPGITYGSQGPQWGGDPLHASLRYDLTLSRKAHDFKVGGEALYWRSYGFDEGQRWGTYVFSANQTPAEFARRFPVWNDRSTWNLTGLDPLVQEFDLGTGNFSYDTRHPSWAVWVGDTWEVSNKLTVNYGIRWDDDLGMACAPDFQLVKTPFAPFGTGAPLYKDCIFDHTDVAPRTGFSYSVNDRHDFVIRGGSGVYYGAPLGNMAIIQMFGQRRKLNAFVNDGRSGFIQAPTRNFTQAQIDSGVVAQAASPIAYDYKMPYSWQSAVGFQKQLGPVMAVDADLSYNVTNREGRARDINLFFDPATGYNLDPRFFGRPDPNWAQVTWMESSGKLRDVRLSTSLTRRLKNDFQASVTYTHVFFRKDNTDGSYNSIPNNSFNMNDDWAPAADFQRHTMRANAIIKLPWDLSLAGLYQFGSGSRFLTTVSGRPYNKPATQNRLNLGPPITIQADVLDRFDGPAVIGTGQTVPKDALSGFPLHKVDLRLTKVISLGVRMRLAGMAEVFNVFNHANYGSYSGQVNAPNFGAPLQNLGNAYGPRTGQLGFRFSF